MKKVFFLSFQDVLNKIMLVLSRKSYRFQKSIQISRLQKSCYCWKFQSKGFQTWINSKKPHKYKMSSKKILCDLLLKKTIDPISFMKMFWLISAK